MDQIRILMTAMPRLLHEIVETMVASQPDMTITGQVRQSESVALAAERLHANIVILGESHDEPGEAPWRVLNENPRLKLLAISNDGLSAIFYELRPHQMVMEDISPEDIIDAIRASMMSGNSENSIRHAR